MKNIKKLLSLLLCGIMLFGMFPAYYVVENVRIQIPSQ